MRSFTVRALSTPVFGRVLCSARDQHFVVDGPDYNDCPGEALTPPEIFLGGVLTCGVELMQVIARDEGITVGAIRGKIEGFLDRDHPVREDVTVFNRATIEFIFTGTNRDDAQVLIDGYRARCPLYGSLAVATPEVEVSFQA